MQRPDMCVLCLHVFVAVLILFDFNLFTQDKNKGGGTLIIIFNEYTPSKIMSFTSIKITVARELLPFSFGQFDNTVPRNLH